jgi:hypothetical protein
MSTQEPDAKRRKVEQSDDMICEEDGPESTVIKPFPDPSQCSFFQIFNKCR